MTTIRIFMAPAGVTSSDSTWNYNIPTVGDYVLLANASDIGGNLTGISLSAQVNSTTVINDSGIAVSGAGGWPQDIFQSYTQTGSNILTFGGFTVGENVTINFSGHRGAAATRDTQFTIDASSIVYDNSGTTTPTAPASISGVADASGEIIVSVAAIDGVSYINGMEVIYGSGATPSLRKSSQFTVETTLAGTVTSATLNGAAITVDSHVGTTVTLTDSDGSITTSGEYALVLTDNAAATETITVQVNVYGVAPSNNPLQKDGAALASLANVEVRVSAGATLAGSQLFYSGTATTDVSGNLGNIDLSSTAAADADPVLLSIRTAAGDSIVASETVGII